MNEREKIRVGMIVTIIQYSLLRICYYYLHPKPLTYYLDASKSMDQDLF
jgi:hypothetical protein